jgi:DNA/RNA endonuclease YhcR with UshA esterase domain
VGTNTDFYKKTGFFFLGLIIVLFVAKYTVFTESKSLPYTAPSGEAHSSSYEKINKVISWQEADKYYGKSVTVEGKIVKTYNSGKVVFLNFHPDYKRYFTAVIFKSAFSKFPNNPENYYMNKKVQITGLVKNYQGSPEIILNSPSQIKIIEE